MKFSLILATRHTKSCEYNTMPAAGIGYLAGTIRENMRSVEVCLETDVDELIANNPDIVGISSVTEHYHIAKEWANKIKRSLNIPVIIGGIHITLLPESMDNCFDVAVIGEGEHTIVELLKVFEKNDKALPVEDIESINGVCFVKDGEIVKTPSRPLIQNLDDIPTVKYDTLPYYNKNTVGCIVASRGCPYKCSFCASEKMFQQYRSFSVDRIMQDIRYLIKIGKKHIVFYDDLLVADKNKLESLVRAIEKEKINKVCGFSCQVRANRVTPEICILLKRMGVKDAGIGIESFSDKILRYYNKTGVTSQVNQEAIDLMHHYGIALNTNIIFGAPIETHEDMLLTFRSVYRNISENKINIAMWGLLRPYPGTAIWDYSESRGMVSSNMDFGKFSDWSTFDLYLCENVSREDFMTMMREWGTKITLLYQKKGILSPPSNFAIGNRSNLHENVAWMSSIISAPERGSELGDELIKEASKQEYIAYLDGWYHSENNTRWMSKESKTLLNSSRLGIVILNGYVPANILENVYCGNLEISVYVDDKKVVTHNINQSNCSDGTFMLEVPVKKEKKFTLTIRSDKSFVPSELKISDDTRELSFMLTLIEAL